MIGIVTRFTIWTRASNSSSYLARIMPPSAFELVDATMLEVSPASGGGKLSFGFSRALWAASNGMTAITESLNAAYDVEEYRPWWKTATGRNRPDDLALGPDYFRVAFGSRG